jgi:glycosyltransferase involved in cell wall biosynthesis
LARASVYVLPAVDEPFGMTVLEAASVGTPAVVTDSCGVGPDLAERGAVTVTEPAASRLAAAVRQILEDPATRQAMSEAGPRAVQDAYGIGAVVDQLETAYTRAVEQPPRRGRSAARR